MRDWRRSGTTDTTLYRRQKGEGILVLRVNSENPADAFQHFVPIVLVRRFFSVVEKSVDSPLHPFAGHDGRDDTA